MGRKRVPAGSFERLSSSGALWRAWCAYREGKRRRAHVAAFDIEADRHLFALGRALRSGRYRPGRRALHVKRDPKPRLIAVAPVADRVIEQALVTEIGPTFERSFLDHSYGCRTGRGPLRATLQAWRWMRRHQWMLHLDVRSYFASIDHQILRELYAARLHDERTLALVDRILEAGGAVYRSAPARRLGGPEPREGRGLPVGSLVSHFSGALYLDRLDHYVKRELKVPAYLRFMDDVLLLTDDRDELAAAWSAVAHWLATERDLTLKPTREGIVSTRAGLTLLGWRVTRGGLQPSRTGRRRLLRRLRHRIHRGPGAVRDAIAAAEHRWRFG